MHRHIMIVSPRGTADALPALRAVRDWSLSLGDSPWLPGTQHSRRFRPWSRDVMIGAKGDGNAQGEMAARPRLAGG